MGHIPVAAVQVCPLCGSNDPLCNSHIIPHFVFEYLRETSATGHIRHAEQPNLRVQDGPKQPLLCERCECLLSGWEKEVAERLFKPYHNDSKVNVPYGPWLARFAASLCWRCLFIFRAGGLEHLSEEQKRLVDKALDFWREMMLDRREHPGEFELHLIPVDAVSSARGIDFPASINRYLARTIESDVISGERSAFVFVKLYKLLFLGFVQMPSRPKWENTRLKVKRGTIKPEDRVVPIGLDDILVARAKNYGSLHDKISERQKEKIAASLHADLDRVAESETFKAVSHDVEMFGRAAFKDRD